jgi:hypothetical protein
VPNNIRVQAGPDEVDLSPINTPNPEDLLRRRELSEALRRRGFPVAGSTLATLATRGGGPPYRLFGRVPLYKWRDGLAWALAKTTPALSNSSEHRVATAQKQVANSLPSGRNGAV